MYPAWDLQDPFVEMLLKNRWLGPVALALPALILFGSLVSRIWPRLLEKGHLRWKVLVVFHRAVRFLNLPYVLLFAAVTVGMALIAIAVHVLGLHWNDVAQALLQVPLASPIAQGLTLMAVVSGGLMICFTKSDSKRMLAGIILGLGMAVGALNFLCISIVQN